MSADARKIFATVIFHNHILYFSDAFSPQINRRLGLKCADNCYWQLKCKEKGTWTGHQRHSICTIMMRPDSLYISADGYIEQNACRKMSIFEFYEKLHGLMSVDLLRSSDIMCTSGICRCKYNFQIMSTNSKRLQIENYSWTAFMNDLPCLCEIKKVVLFLMLSKK